MDDDFNLINELNTLFGSIGEDFTNKINNDSLILLQKQTWMGKPCNKYLRAICWRVFLGLLKTRTYEDWVIELKQQLIDYKELKLLVNPGIEKVQHDPLSSLISDEGGEDHEWSLYYRKLEMANLIRVDLDRLYMPGLTDEYFHEISRKERLLEVLLIWSLKNIKIGYRQGMHEIAGTILYVLDTEREAWNSIQNNEFHVLKEVLTDNDESFDSQFFFIFERIMKDMIALYDPIPLTTGTESVPQIVDYCTKLQGIYAQFLLFRCKLLSKTLFFSYFL